MKTPPESINQRTSLPPMRRKQATHLEPLTFYRDFGGVQPSRERQQANAR